MTTIDDAISGRLPPSVYRVRSALPAAAVRRAVEAAGRRCYVLDGAGIADKVSFLRACAAAMDFPSHFGTNWDALVDCLRDLDEETAPAGYVLLYDGWERFAAAQPTEWATARDILAEFAERTDADGPPVHVLLRRTPRPRPTTLR